MIFLLLTSLLISMALFLFITIQTSTIEITKTQESSSSECPTVKYLGGLMTAFMILLLTSLLLQFKVLMNAICDVSKLE